MESSAGKYEPRELEEKLRETQAKLHKLREEYAEVFDKSPLGMCAINAAGYIVEANLAISHMLGVTRHELKTHNIRKYLDEVEIA